VNITSATGVFTVPLGFSVPVGTNLQLGLSSGSTCNLYRNNNGVTYPYTTAGVLSVTTSSASSNPGSYYYYLYNWQIQEGSCSSARIPVTGAIDALVNAAFTQSIASSSVTFTNTSTNATSYYWDFGDGQSSTQTSPFHTYGADGSYPVMMIASNTCGSDTAWYTAVISTVGGVSAINMASQITIYPNPAKDMIYLNLNSNAAQDCSYEIINMVGESVIKGQLVFAPGNPSVPVDVAALKQGIYFIKLMVGDASVTRKMIIDN
jgi:PKD repeat protein